MAGKTDQMIRRLEREMAQASAELEFERAARLRDDVEALRRAMEKQAVVFGDGTDADVVAFAQDDLEAAVQVFHVRGGRVRGQRGWVIDKAPVDGDVTTGDLVEHFVSQFYGSDDDREDTAAIPREILVPELPDNAAVLDEWLSLRRGTRVALRVPQRGDKRALLETVGRNAAQAFTQHKLKRASDLTARSQALAELQDALGLTAAPLRIECFDVSHVQGTNVVASMVVFEDGLARKSEYRRFAMRESGGDTDWIAEAVRRRFARYLDERVATGEAGVDDRRLRRRDPAGHRPDHRPAEEVRLPTQPARRRRWRAPGSGRAGGARRARHRRRRAGRPRQAPRGGVAAGESYPVILPRTSEGLYLLQRVRDEAHRFAITFHRQKRSRAMTTSVLDGIAGLGETRRKALLAHFGSIKRLRQAGVDDVATVPGIGRKTAEAIVTALADTARDAVPAVNVTTGEVLDGSGR